MHRSSPLYTTHRDRNGEMIACFSTIFPRFCLHSTRSKLTDSRARVCCTLAMTWFKKKRGKTGEKQRIKFSNGTADRERGGEISDVALLR